MKCVVVIPVGPGHERLAERAVASVYQAWAHDRGPFSHMDVQRVEDHCGELGRSRARNLGMDLHPRADWFFLLDADDCMVRQAFRRVDLEQPATFGKILLSGISRAHNVYPCTRADLFRHGAHGTLTMGFFVRGDLGLRFNEAMDAGEDFDFYLRLPGFVKISEPLADIGYHQPSAGGPRGYTQLDWLKVCNGVIDSYRNQAHP